MPGKLNLPKFVDFRNKVKRHPTKKFPDLPLKNKTTIAIHHSLTSRKLAGSNAEGYARYHVDTHGWPSIGYHYVIEADGTIKFCNEINLRTYHVGNRNNYAVGICLSGDFRYEYPTPKQEESLRNLVNALKKEYPHIKHVKGHSEFSGYEWKQFLVFDYEKVLSVSTKATKPAKSQPAPKTYTVQEGATFWSIAKGLPGVTADDLMKANPYVDSRKLRIGQKINLVVAKPKAQPKKPKQKTSTYTGTSIVDYLRSIGMDPSFNNRKQLAVKYGIKNYRGTVEQNLASLNAMRNGAKPKAAPKRKPSRRKPPPQLKSVPR